MRTVMMALMVLCASTAVSSAEEPRPVRIRQTIIVMCVSRLSVDCNPRDAVDSIFCSNDVYYARCPQWSGRRDWAPIQESAQYRDRGFGRMIVVILVKDIPFEAFRPHRETTWLVQH